MERQMKPEILSAIETSVMEISARQRKDFSRENRVLFTYAENDRMDPETCARRVNEQWRQNETGGSVIYCFRAAALTPQEKRKRVFNQARNEAEKIAAYLTGTPFQPGEIEAMEDELAERILVKRVILIELYRMLPQLQSGSSFPYMLRLNKEFAAECVDAMLTIIKIELGGEGGTEEYEKEIFRLEEELKRANRMLVRLQDDFDERIEENRREEAESLISQLNSDRYGHILDLLMNLQTELRGLRRAGRSIPLEIGALPALLRNLRQFVEDCGITPMLGIGEERTIRAADAVNYQYQGTPFADETEEKKVVVMTAGWEIREKEAVISKPAVQEKECANERKE